MLKKIIIVFTSIIISIILLYMGFQNRDVVATSGKTYKVPYYAKDVCSYNNYLYYIIDNNNYIYIKELDGITQDTETIYEYSADGNININELYAVDNYVIWVENSNDLKWKIIKYNMTNKEKTVIRTFEQSNNSLIPTCLAVNNNFIAWYESTYNNQNDLNEVLIIYNIKNSEVIKKNIQLMGNPYLRPYIRNNYISYIIKENTSYLINIYNLITGEVNKIDFISKVAKIMSNGEYTVWIDDYDARNIYIFDNKSKNYRKIEGSLNIFTFMLINNNLYISYSKDNSGYANIYVLDLKNNTNINLTNNDDQNTYYYISKLNVDNKLLYEKIRNGEKEIILEN